MGDGASPDINREIPNKDQTRTDKNANKSVKNPLKRFVGKAILAGLVLTPGIIHDTKAAPVIENPAAVASSYPIETDVKNPVTPEENNYLNFGFEELRQKPRKYYNAREIDLVSTGLKEAGFERILVENESRAPTDEELKELKTALSFSPYCSGFAPQLYFRSNDGEFYSGFAFEKGTIGIELPSQAPPLDKAVVPSAKAYNSPFTTSREIIRETYLHECGHKILYLTHDYVNLRNLREGKPTHAIPEDTEFYDSSGSPNPLLRSFAQLKGVGTRQIKDNRLKLKQYERGNSHSNSEAIYEYNNIIDERLESYYNNQFDEYFVQLFAISRLKPEVLTTNEKEFFDILHKGLMIKEERFLADVAENPRLLLNDTP